MVVNIIVRLILTLLMVGVGTFLGTFFWDYQRLGTTLQAFEDDGSWWLVMDDLVPKKDLLLMI